MSELFTQCKNDLEKKNAKAGEKAKDRIRSPFSSLPEELHGMIFHELDISGVIRLSFTNKYFLQIGRSHIQKYCMMFLGPWAGEKIVCIGQDIKARDHPPGMLTKDQEDDIAAICDSYDEEDLDEPGVCLCDDADCVNHGLSYYGYYCYEKVAGYDKIPDILLERMVEHMNETLSYSGPDQCIIFKVIRPKLPIFYPTDSPWILRNLTTKEFVRSEAIALKPEYIHGPDIDALGFGHVVLSRICWSTSDNTSMSYDGDIHRGIWAGHRFDITTLARHKDNSKGNEWKDVSEEVMEEISKIWESKYGTEWREVICREEEKHLRR